jgi:hypothetical protein
MPYGAFSKYGALKYKGEMLPRPAIPYLTEQVVTTTQELTNAVVIPFQSYPWFKESTILDNTLYQFEFQWSERGQYWTTNIFNDNDEPILTGVKISINSEIINMYSRSQLPFGYLLPVDEKGSYTRIEETDLGARVAIIYVPKVIEISNAII